MFQRYNRVGIFIGQAPTLHEQGPLCCNFGDNLWEVSGSIHAGMEYPNRIAVLLTRLPLTQLVR